MRDTATSLLWIMLCSVLAPLLAGLVPRKLLPEVVLLLLLGVVVGPNVLDLAQTTEAIDVLRELGLGMLFLLAGYEIELEELTGPGGRRAWWTWLTCMIAALAVVWLLGLSGAIQAEVAVAIALTSTSLGTLLPILKDAGLLATGVGKTVMHHGAFGERGRSSWRSSGPARRRPGRPWCGSPCSCSSPSECWRLSSTLTWC